MRNPRLRPTRNPINPAFLRQERGDEGGGKLEARSLQETFLSD